MHRLWPHPDPEPLDDSALTALYTPTDRTRPWLRVNFVTSLDGAVTVDGYSEGLSGPADKQVFGRLRMLCDALLVGAGTLRHEGYGPLRLSEDRRAWRVEHGLAEYPTLVIVSGRLALAADHPALADAPVRPVVLTYADAPADRRAELSEVADVVTVDAGVDGIDLPAAIATLHGRGYAQLLCEGGPHLFGTLTEADLVDELCLTLSPLLTGPGAGRITAGPHAPEPRTLQLRHIVADGDMLMLRYAR